MWYALQCKNTSEELILESCRQSIGDGILDNALLFTYEKLRRYKGGWHKEETNLFPSYIFLESHCLEELSKKLSSNYPELCIGEDSQRMQTVSDAEMYFLQEFCGKKHHLPISRGMISNGTTHVLEGPLVGKERFIRKIDRHKRLAFLDVPQLTLNSGIKVGLEITEKH